MNASIANRAAAIRHCLDRLEADPRIARRYALVAARWEALRLARDEGKTTPADDARFQDLTGILRALTGKLELVTRPGPEGIDGITARAGFLPHDSQRIVHAETWRTAAEGW